MDDPNPLPMNPSRKSRLGRRSADVRRPEPWSSDETVAPSAPAESEWSPTPDSAADEPTPAAGAAPAEPDASPWEKGDWQEQPAGDAQATGGIADSEPLLGTAAAPVHRRRRPRTDRPARRWSLRPDRNATGGLWRLLGVAIVAGGLGFALGRGTTGDGNGRSGAAAAPASVAPNGPASENAMPTRDPAVARTVDDAFAAMKASRFDDARAAFASVCDRAPSLRTAGAWNEFFAGNFSQAESQVLRQIREGVDATDACFLLGILRLARGDYVGAGQAFAAASALDPTRGDIEFLWGDTLRREGRPREAIAHFRAALGRNRQETNDGYYQYKLWLSQLEAGEVEAAEMEKSLANAFGDPAASGGTSGFIHLALAALAQASGKPVTVVAGHLADARRSLEPTLFRIGLQDPLWTAARTEPGLGGFFR